MTRPILALAALLILTAATACGDPPECNSPCRADAGSPRDRPIAEPDLPTDMATDVGPPVPTLTQLRMRYFTLVCSGCHDGTAQNNAPNLPGKLDLSSTGMVHANVVNIPSTENPGMMLVKPGDPDQSYLFLKLSRPTGDPAIMMKEQMPLDGPYYTDLATFPEALNDFRQWIQAGARDD